MGGWLTSPLWPLQSTTAVCIDEQLPKQLFGLQMFEWSGVLIVPSTGHVHCVADTEMYFLRPSTGPMICQQRLQSACVRRSATLKHREH